MTTTYLALRGGVWHYHRRVPTNFHHIDPRRFVTQSTKIKLRKDPRGVEAMRVADRINDATERYWNGLVQGDAAAAKARYDDAVRRARQMDLAYVEASDLAGQHAELQRRFALLEKTLEAVRANPGLVASYAPHVAAVGGGVPRQTMLFSQLFDAFDNLKKVENNGSIGADQKAVWDNTYKRAANNFIEANRDMGLHEANREHALAYKGAWQKRILAGEVKAASANKDFSMLSSMFRTVVEENKWSGIDPNLFTKLGFREAKNGESDEDDVPAYSNEFIQNVLLADGAFDGLNAEARRIFYIMIETGMRPGEISNMLRKRVIRTHSLPHGIPFLEVRPDGRRLKTKNSLRDVPLVGVALAALDAQLADLPADEKYLFPRYYEKRSWSGNVNQFLENNGLRETPDHVAYSLRHSYDGRLHAHHDWGKSDMLHDLMMGHWKSKVKYTKHLVLEQKREWAETIMFKAWPQNL